MTVILPDPAELPVPGDSVVTTGPRITALRHDALIAGGRFLPWLQEEGLRARVVHLDEGEEVPGIDDVGDGLVVLGGTMSVLDDDSFPFLPAVRELVRQAVDRDVPVMGICLGHQLLADALGGTVHVGVEGATELGPVAVRWTPEAEGDPVVGLVARRRAQEVADGDGDAGGHVTQFHGDAVVAVPPGGTLLASSAVCPVQAFRVGSALGVQFHPEACPDSVREALERVPDLDRQTLESVVQATAAVDDEVVASGRAIAVGFAGEVWRRGVRTPRHA